MHLTPKSFTQRTRISENHWPQDICKIHLIIWKDVIIILLGVRLELIWDVIQNNTGINNNNDFIHTLTLIIGTTK